MLIEIEETVRFLVSFLIGKIPRRRLDDFIEALANLLVERFMKTQNRMRICKFTVNVDNVSDVEIVEAANIAQINPERVRSLWPKSLVLELQPGMIMAINAETGGNKVVYPMRQQLACASTSAPEKVRRGQSVSDLKPGSGTNATKSKNTHNNRERLLRRTQMRIIWASSFDGQACEPENRPFFEIAQDCVSCTAQYFASTRFGSTKPKSHQGYDLGCGFHPFTSPSIYSYVQLLMMLNSLAGWSPRKEKSDRVHNWRSAIKSADSKPLITFASVAATEKKEVKKSENKHQRWGSGGDVCSGFLSLSLGSPRRHSMKLFHRSAGQYHSFMSAKGDI